MRRIFAAAVVITVFGSMALAANTPQPCQISATITTITRTGDGTVTATVAGLADFVVVGDWISVSGVFDNSFNGGPFTLTVVDRLLGSTNLSWNSSVTGLPTTSGGSVVPAVVLPAVGTPNLVVQFSSSQFSVAPVSDPNSAYAFSYGSIAEITPNGSVVKGHKVNLSGNVGTWSQPYTNGTYTLVQLCGAFGVGQNTSTPGFVHFTADHFVYPAPSTVQNGGQVVAIPADTVKLGLDIDGWQFADPGNRLQLQLHINVPGQIDEVNLTRDANGSISQLAVVLSHGVGLKLAFPPTILVDDTNTVGTADGYSVDAKFSDTGIELFLTVPRFLSRVHLDPLVNLAP